MSDNESWADTHWLWHYKDHTVEVRLRDVAGQENADGNEYALMMEAANEITRLKERVEELEKCFFLKGAVYSDGNGNVLTINDNQLIARFMFQQEAEEYTFFRNRLRNLGDLQANTGE